MCVKRVVVMKIGVTAMLEDRLLNRGNLGIVEEKWQSLR
jgi:hypothetical protein